MKFEFDMLVKRFDFPFEKQPKLSHIVMMTEANENVSAHTILNALNNDTQQKQHINKLRREVESKKETKQNTFVYTKANSNRRSRP